MTNSRGSSLLLFLGFLMISIAAYWTAALHFRLPLGSAFRTLYDTTGEVYAPDPETRIGPWMIVALAWFGGLSLFYALRGRK